MMNKINLVKKTYEELQDEVIKLTTDKFLLQNRIDKAIEYLEEPNRDSFDYSKAILLDILKDKEVFGMKIEDYNKYYIQGSDHYLIPKDVFKELFNEMINWKEESQRQKEVIDKSREYLTSYSSIHTIQFGTEKDSLNDIELNKTLDEKTLNEMTNRYLKVHDKLLDILKEVSE